MGDVSGEHAPWWSADLVMILFSGFGLCLALTPYTNFQDAHQSLRNPHGLAADTLGLPLEKSEEEHLVVTLNRRLIVKG